MSPVMFDLVRTSIHRAITTKTGDQFLPVRVPKDLARRFNALLGDPVCSKEELERRRTGRAKLAELKEEKNGRTSASATSSAAPPVQAPVMIYFEEGRRQGPTVGRIKEMLDAKQIAYTLLDVANDETTKEFVLREAKCKDEDLPVVFVASTPVGGYHDLVAWNASGRLDQALAGS